MVRNEAVDEALSACRAADDRNVKPGGLPCDTGVGYGRLKSLVVNSRDREDFVSRFRSHGALHVLKQVHQRHE